ncbi:IMPACT family protein [Geothrix campi]|jgi:putative IMPACT (imprinted ancient) family translation regulator|uniref:IMPACT family protein n=1 Tax=Geothrix campi TaxID=2966450 RepID=UPI002148EF25|nr:YigZ family protein [Geothrix sp. SG10]
MRRLKEIVIHRFREKASVFLTELHPARDAAERSAVLASLRKRDFDATHHCSAWREGVPVAAQGADDDGEPSGTAGRPMLAVLEGAQTTDLIAVCIRWYGGTKLGSGGLVRAYTEGVQGALAEADARGLWEEVRVLRRGEIRVPAAQAHLPFALLGAFPGAALVDQSFEGEWAILRFECPPGLCPALDHAWQERSRGGAIIWD